MKEPSPQMIIVAKCLDHCGVQWHEIPYTQVKSRNKRLVHCREAIAAMLHKHAGMSLPEIAQYMGMKAHSAVRDMRKRYYENWDDAERRRLEVSIEGVL